jgi:NSS family neurotransmitter:Na+ symporter
MVAIIAGLAIFPIVFANNLDPDAGPGLVFVVLPLAFSQMSGGIIIGTVFFLLLAFAALTSAISLLEVPVAWLEERHKWTRKSSTITIGLGVWLVGLASALSTNVLASIHPLWFINKFSQTGILDLLDYITGQALLPLGGILISIFVGWKISQKTLKEELNINQIIFSTWYFLIRFICPAAILSVLIAAWL